MFRFVPLFSSSVRCCCCRCSSSLKEIICSCKLSGIQITRSAQSQAAGVKTSSHFSLKHKWCCIKVCKCEVTEVSKVPPLFLFLCLLWLLPPGAFTHLHMFLPAGDAAVRCEQLDLLLQWGAEFRQSSCQSPEGEKVLEDLVAFDVILGDLNFDNCSSGVCRSSSLSVMTCYLITVSASHFTCRTGISFFILTVCWNWKLVFYSFSVKTDTGWPNNTKICWIIFFMGKNKSIVFRIAFKVQRI